MKIIMMPGTRNEELIQEILNNKKTLSADEWQEYCEWCARQGDEYLDALYYACNNRNAMLKDQTEYFHDCLLNDEAPYYAARMGGYDL